MGSGSFGTVVSASNKKTSALVALKIQSKVHILQTKQLQHVTSEREILQMLDHQFILKLHGTYQTEDDIIIVTELLEYGDLWSAIYESPLSLGGMPSDLIRFYAASLVLALSHIHSKGVAYRDLKPENVMLDKKGYIRIIDFGFAKSIPYYYYDEKAGVETVHNKTYSLCGTPGM